MSQPKVSAFKGGAEVHPPFMPHIPALSHFFGWGGAFVCVRSENSSSSKLKQEQ